MSNSKENFEDYQEGGVFESLFGKKKPPPAPTSRNPFANAPLQTPPSVLAQQRAALEAQQRAAAEAKRQAEEQKKKYGLLSDYSIVRQAIDAKAKAAAATSRLAKQTVALGTAAMTSKPKLRVMNPLDPDLSNDNNTPITHTDFTITYNNLMELYKKIDTLSGEEKGEKVSNELKILRSLVGESFTKTEECITDIFNALVEFNKNVLSDKFDINELKNVKKSMYSLSERFLPNIFVITDLIRDYVKNNYRTINSADTLSSTNTEILKFYIRMLIIIFYPKIILNMISDKMIDYIVAIKEKRDHLLDGGDDNIIERLLDGDYSENYSLMPSRSPSTIMPSRNPSAVSWQSGVSSDSGSSSLSGVSGLSSLSGVSGLSSLSDDAVPPASGVVTTSVGGTPLGDLFMRGLDKNHPTLADGVTDAIARRNAAAAAAAAPAGAAPAAALPSAPASSTDPLISFYKSNNPYIQQSGFIFYNALTNFAVSISIYNNNYKEYIVTKLEEIIRDKFGIIDDDEKGKDYAHLKATTEKEYNAYKDALNAIPDGREYIKYEESIEVLKNEYNEEENNLKANPSLLTDINFMKEYNAIKDSLNKAIYDLGVIRYKIETLPLAQVPDSVVHYLNAKLKLKIASEEPDIQKEMSEAFIKLLALDQNLYFDKIMDDIYYLLPIPGTITEVNYPLALNKYITSGIGKSIMFQFNVPKSAVTSTSSSSSIISRLNPFSRNAKGGKRGTRRYKKRAGTRRQKKRRGTHRKRKNTTK
jgi:hypothetical protein